MATASKPEPRVLPDLSMQARIAELEAQLLAERAAKVSGKAFRLAVAKSGGVSAYGLQRFPVTLYAEQWEAVLSHADAIKAFLAEHSAELKRKPA